MEIRIHPDHLRTVASQLSHQSEEIQALLENMLRTVGGLSIGWAGLAWNAYLDCFQTEVPRMQDSLRETLTGLIQDLRRIADEFERTDQGTVAASGARAGAVLGVSTAVPTAILASAAGAHPPSEHDWLALKLQIPRLLPQWEQEQQAVQKDLTKTDDALADLERRIRDLQARRDALQEQARQWPNRVLPDTERPGLGFDDGLMDAPWRTRSDAMEDQIADYDRQIQSLREEQARLLQQRDELRARLDELGRQMEQARKMGPLTPTDVRRWVELDHGRLPGDEQCVHWAQDRSPSLGGPPLPAVGKYPTDDLGARQYLKIFNGQTFQVPQNTTDLTRVPGLEAGACVVWDKGHPDTRGTAGYTYGHIAVIEAVQPDGVWVSQANWPGHPVMFIPRDKLSTLYVIPRNARPVTPEEFRKLQSAGRI